MMHFSFFLLKQIEIEVKNTVIRFATIHEKLQESLLLFLGNLGIRYSLRNVNRKQNLMCFFKPNKL